MDDQLMENNPGRRARRIANGQEVLGFKKVTTSALKIGEVISFIYNARMPGWKDKPYFDANPTVVFLGIQRSKDGNIYAVGFNVNYLEKQVDKRKVILRMRTGLRLPSQFFQKAIHAYRLDRVISPVYRGIDIAVDPILLTSEALWRFVDNM